VETGDDTAKPDLPTKFEPNKWVSWSKEVENYLWQLKGQNSTPLIYVIRKERTATSPPFTSSEEERIYQVSHRGPVYAWDNNKVMEILTGMDMDIVLRYNPQWERSVPSAEGSL
jgi:hypothetical protein